MTIIYALAALGAYRVVRRAVIVAVTLWGDIRSKPTPWLGLPWGPG